MILFNDSCKNCVIQTGYGCRGNVGSLSDCFEVCGDGKNMGRKPCDDNNVSPRDGYCLLFFTLIIDVVILVM